MNLGLTCALLLAAGSLVAAGEPKKVTKLQIGVKKRVENCEVKSRKGDKLSMHYRGSLHSDGSEFDSSYERGEPLSFTLGSGQVSSVHMPIRNWSSTKDLFKQNNRTWSNNLCVQVIKGWDQGLLAMCVGEKRKLVIPPDLGYGDSGAGDKIPGGAVLVFEVELVDIQRKNEL